MFKGKTVIALALATSFAFLSSCSKEEITPSGDAGVSERVEQTVYILDEVDGSGVSGTATFKKVGNKTKVTLNLDGTEAGDMHPAHIHFNSVAIGGGVAVSLTSVEGESGNSVTMVSALDDGTPISYEELLVFNGYINVHLSMDSLGVIIAQGNIGSNAD